MKERRQAPRRSARLEVIVYDFSCDLTVRSAQTVNLSSGGFCVSGGAAVRAGEPVSFILSLPGLGRVSGRGVCRWSAAGDGGRRWGARIDNMAAEDAAKLSAYLGPAAS